jgi:hypothetical protein
LFFETRSQAEQMELQHVRDKKHVFFNKKQKLQAVAPTGSAAAGSEQRTATVTARVPAQAAKRAGGTLSFADDEHDGGSGGS